MRLGEFVRDLTQAMIEISSRLIGTEGMQYYAAAPYSLTQERNSCYHRTRSDRRVENRASQPRAGPALTRPQPLTPVTGQK